ncbi:bifunctional diguanylate cyclase/phosphodiesterase [Candidatus Magnetominusculus xianensis]|uniref:Diguanylate cyclase n=1 Tax=Candidatus Magnetominusculus xianensis TaxID=1748249 RepID=A0ABR5SL84_9BACT|nr:EAL domain-containing protein [Candidatus Magnetominusculus xianensis]KWT90525.1 diguanylate cyclase [Candidatus Magnetominusculus xianensis]MBF0404150.1 EAL domain-containing protein [Nitrospirota bacterium]
MDTALLLDGILRSSMDMAIAAADLDLIVRYVNPAAEKMLGCNAADVIGKSVALVHMIGNVAAERFDAAMEILRRDGEHVFTFMNSNSGGEQQYIEARVSAIWSIEHTLIGYAMAARDVTQRRLSAESLQYRVQIDKLIASISTSFINIAASEVKSEIRNALERVGIVLGVDNSCAVLNSDEGVPDELFLWSPHQLPNTSGKCNTQLLELREDNKLQLFTSNSMSWFREMIGKGEVLCINTLDTVPEPERSILSSEGLKSMIVAPMSLAGGFLAFSTIMSERHWSAEDILLVKMISEIFANAITRGKNEQMLKTLAHYDALTGLPNRILFNDRLNQAIEQAMRNSRLMAVLFLDLDNFKLINDTLGHNIGDLLLVEASQRLLSNVRKSDTVARMGGDEFTIILSNIARDKYAVSVANKIIDAISKPFHLNGHECSVGVSIGVSIFPNDAADADVLLKNADIAMYQVKERGRNGFQFYSAGMNTRAVKRLKIENNLRKNLEKQLFKITYQPQLDINTGMIIGLEALLHWEITAVEDVSQREIVSVAEESGLIIPIGQWFLRCVCAQGSQWQAQGFQHVHIAVKIHTRQFKQENLTGIIKQTLDETDLVPNSLELELTEGTIMQDVEQSIGIIKDLKAIGLYITIDDFGTGYSSLSHLKRFPIDSLKIDRQFIKNVTTDMDYAAIAKAIIALAHTLNMTVTAEGVETVEQLEFLRSLKCDEAQGNLFSSPLSAEDISQQLIEEQYFIIFKRETGGTAPHSG